MATILVCWYAEINNKNGYCIIVMHISFRFANKQWTGDQYYGSSTLFTRSIRNQYLGSVNMLYNFPANHSKAVFVLKVLYCAVLCGVFLW